MTAKHAVNTGGVLGAAGSSGITLLMTPCSY
jgi:hypothetical protein